MTETHESTEPEHVVGRLISICVEVDPIATGVGDQVRWAVDSWPRLSGDEY